MVEFWNDCAIEKFSFEERDALVVFPEKGRANGRLVIKTE